MNGRKEGRRDRRLPSKAATIMMGGRKEGQLEGRKEGRKDGRKGGRKEGWVA
jgi:hypothetical protein